MKKRVQYTVMTDSELSHMKNRMEQLLIERGIRLDHQEMLKELSEKGCQVDFESKELKFTKEVIEKALAAVPASFTLYSPDGEHNMTFPHPEGNFYTRTNTGAPKYRTVEGDTHYVKPEEVEEWFKLCNDMEFLDFVALPSISGEYVPEEAVDVCTLELALKYSKKHIWIQPYESENVKYLIQMSQAAAGGEQELKEKPIVSMISCSVPTLNFKHMDAEILYLSAKYGVPVQPCSLPTAGANAPVTAVGTAFLASAEVMAQIIMLELLCPGLPVIATPLLFSMDMMSTYTLQSNTEITVARAIAMELFENGYHIPAHSYGTGTDSLTLDAQNFIERTNLIDIMALSAGSILGGAGQLETAKTISPIQLIIDNEIFGIARRERAGLCVDDETLNWEELIAGIDKEPAFSYLMSEHTMRHFEEPHRPDMFNRDGLVQWERAGSKTLTQKATDKFYELIEERENYELARDKMEKVEEIKSEAIKALHKQTGEK